MDTLATGLDVATRPAARNPGAAHLAATLNAAPFGIVTIDASLRVLFANDRLGDVLAIPPDALAGAPCLPRLLSASTTLGPAAGQAIGAFCATAIETGELARDVAFTTDAGPRCVALRVVPLADGSWRVSIEDVTRRHVAENRAASPATVDPLTGLLNRQMFEQRATVALDADPAARAGAGTGAGHAILLIDLDRFRAVNETLGHAVADRLLGVVGKRLQGMLRGTDALARLGGDEFALLLSPAPEPDALSALAGRIVDLLGRPYLIDGHMVNVGASVGMAVQAPDHGRDYDTLLRSAELALHDAKKSGRSTFRLFNRQLDLEASLRRSLEIDLRKALALGEFSLDYQPQIDLDHGAITGFEALLRWRHPERGLVSPASFIPLAEEIGLIVPLGEWVLREACREAARWPETITVAVNVSPGQFNDPDALTNAIARALRLANLPGHRLEIEITEGALLHYEQPVLQALNRLRAMGVRVAMDDFGTGYSSLSQLQSFPFDKIKIDQSFVRGAGNVASQNSIIRAIAALGVSLGMGTIAEGVETDDQLARIRAGGCTSVQGYLFSRPVTPAQIDQLLARFPASTSRP